MVDDGEAVFELVEVAAAVAVAPPRFILDCSFLYWIRDFSSWVRIAAGMVDPAPFRTASTPEYCAFRSIAFTEWLMPATLARWTGWATLLVGGGGGSRWVRPSGATAPGKGRVWIGLPCSSSALKMPTSLPIRAPKSSSSCWSCVCASSA